MVIFNMKIAHNFVNGTQKYTVQTYPKHSRTCSEPIPEPRGHPVHTQTFSESAHGRRANRARATRHEGKLACRPSQPAQQQLPDGMRRSPSGFRAPEIASSQLPAKRASSTLVKKWPAGPWIARVLVGRARAQHARSPLENAVPPHEKVVS